jgi:hypothetical protein
MSDSLHDEHVPHGTPRSDYGRRVDEIHVHRRDRRSSGWRPWLLLLAVLLLALWGAFGRQESRPVVSACAAADVSFEPGSSAISAANRGTLRSLASCLRANSARKVRLEGRESRDERGGLARERADVMASGLRALGVPAAQLSVGVGSALCVEARGSAREQNTDASDACARKNRSVSATPLLSRSR